jgi:acyl-homoserine-lactone acylase
MKRRILALWVMLLALAGAASAARSDAELWRRVEVIRTAHGVPHIRARDLKAAGYALGWMMLEDYGRVAAADLLESSGRWAAVDGYERVESDFVMRTLREKTLAKFPQLSKDVRDVYEGFAAGVNRYVELHPDEFISGMPRDFTGQDVLATEIAGPSPRKVRMFLNRLDPQRFPIPQQGQQNQPGEGEDEFVDPLNDGSNAWALAPSRTKSGKAILLRNPHLAWNAGYYEAHVTVPGVLDFYGDFRIGGPFTVIGGFNRYLGFSTTNNQSDQDVFYELDVDPTKRDHYLFDGGSVPLKRELVTVSFKNGEGVSTETREFWSTPLGPVVHRGKGKVYVIKYAGEGEHRAGEQFLRMMRAKSLDEYKDAMRMRARSTSNFTYADKAGNIYYLWMASLPKLPHAPGDDLAAVPARKTADVWTELVPFDALPQVLNPPGGYIHQENSSPHYTNVRTPVKTENAYPNFEEPRLSLRSQLAIQLIGGDEKYSLEEVWRLKHSYRALLADRVKADLLAALKATNHSGDTTAAIEMLEKWDNTTSPESRGSTLFEVWWQHYSGLRPGEQRSILPDEQRYAKVWSMTDPLNTPRGLADASRAVDSFAWAVEETKRRYGRIDVPWGEVHRVRRGSVDVPVGGCGNDMGCFRILAYQRDKDGKLAANSGDGWVMAVEFGDVPRAMSVLAYGQSRKPDSPWHADQAEMFAAGGAKKVLFTEKEIDAGAVLRFRPGAPASR